MMHGLSVRVRTILCAALVATIAIPVVAQEQESILDRAKAIEVEPSELTLGVGEKATLTATVKDEDGNEVPAPVIFITRARRDVGVTATGEVAAYSPGEFTVVAIVPSGEEGGRRRGARPGELSAEVRITIPQPPLDRITVEGIPGKLYAGSLVRGTVEVYDTSDTMRPDETVEFRSSDSTVVRVDRYGQVTPLAVGTATLTLTAGFVTEELSAIHFEAWARIW